MRGSSGDPRRPPAVRRLARRDAAVVLTVALALLLVVGGAVVVLHDRRAHDRAAATPSPSPSAAGPVAVAGDALGTDGAEWTAALAADARVPVAARVSPGAGYLVGAPGETIGDLAARVPSTVAVVLLIGGGADAGRGAADLLRAEAAAVAAARAAAPRAAVVLVGPVSASGTATVRTSLAETARRAGVRFVDPVAERWLSAAQAGAAGEQPDADGRTALAARLAAVLGSR